MNNKLKIKVPTCIVRNENIQLSNGEFLLYARLSFLYFRNYQKEEIIVDHKKLMLNIGITDSRTLKKYINNLYKTKLIKNNISQLSRKGRTQIIFNSEILKDQQFTLMNADIFNYIGRIGENEFRLIWYYKSHINIDDKNSDKSFCYVSYKTLGDNLKMGNTTIHNANKILLDNKLIKIDKHELGHNFEYNENDELIFTKYNNHYYVNSDLF